MLLDALTTLSDGQDLTGISAATPSTNVLDLSVQRDIGTSKEPIVVAFPVPPTSATGGATLNIAIQTSLDNATWVTIEETGPQVLTTGFGASVSFGFRGTLPVGVKRYLRMLYTPSAALTACTVTACVGAEWPSNTPYARNYVA